jgi:hypothetical protein
MLQVTAQTRILVCVEPVDFRNGIDGLAALRWAKTRFAVRCSSFATGAARRSRRWLTTAKASGFARSGFRKDGFAGGPQPRISTQRCWPRTSCRYCFPPAILGA